VQEKQCQRAAQVKIFDEKFGFAIDCFWQGFHEKCPLCRLMDAKT
jgi:hypothetical protein